MQDIKIVFSNGKHPNALHFHGPNIKQLPRTFDYVFHEKLVNTNYDRNKLAIVSTWTDNEKCCLLQQCNQFNIPLINCVPDSYDRTQPWYMPNKINFFLNILEHIEQEYVMFLDGYDVLLTDLDDVVEKFENLGYDILFGPSCNNYPEQVIDIVPDRSKKGLYRYFNAGCVIGKKESLKNFYTESLQYINIDNPLNSEQTVIRHVFAKYSEDLKQRYVGVDFECNIFQSMGLLDCNVDYNNRVVHIKPNTPVKRHIIVTGADGFIGNYLSVQLNKDIGNVVHCIDRKRGVETSGIDFLFNSTEIDCVYHLAAQTSVFNKDHLQIVNDNISEFVRVVDICKKFHTKLIYTSSSTANPSNTTSLYGLSKQFDEAYAHMYYPEAVGVRLHNVYGKNPRKDTLLWCLLNKDVELYNNGQNKRSFTYLDDVVRCLIDAYNFKGGLYNCVNPQTWTTEEFAKEVAKYRNVNYKLVPDIREMDNLVQSVNSHIPLIKYNYTSIEEGLKKTLG